MKNIIIAILLFNTVCCFSQDKKFDYENLSNPSPKNELSKYLKKEIKRKYLKKARFLKDRENIILSFKINQENKPFRISISTYGSSDLYNSVKDAFEKYPIEKLNIKKIDRKNRYSIQIISKKGRRKIFNASSKVIVETPPICNSCEDLEFFDDIKTCLNTAVKKHLYKSLDFSKIEKGDISLFIQFGVNKNGMLINKKSRIPEDFIDEVVNALNSFPKIEKVSTLDGNKTEAIHSFRINIKKGKKPEFKERFSHLKEITKPTTDNPFSEYLSKNLDAETINKADLNRINNRLYINFELDKKQKPFNLSSNSRSKDLENSIFSLFKKYPIEKLNITDKRDFNRYGLQIFSFENKKSIVKTSTQLSIETPPIFPGCENSPNTKELKMCFSKGVETHFKKNFDSELPNRLGLSQGRKKVFIGFKIDKNGNIIDVKVKAPHPAIKIEVKKVIYSLPKVIPGKQTGKNVNVKYSIPFTLIVS